MMRQNKQIKDEGVEETKFLARFTTEDGKVRNCFPILSDPPDDVSFYEKIKLWLKKFLP